MAKQITIKNIRKVCEPEFEWRTRYCRAYVGGARSLVVATFDMDGRCDVVYVLNKVSPSVSPRQMVDYMRDDWTPANEGTVTSVWDLVRA